jgi:hypothetical protein
MGDPAVGLSLGPGPLTKATLLDLPPRARFGPALVKLEDSLRNGYLRAIERLFLDATSATRMAAMAAVQRDFAGLLRALRQYLDVDFAGPTAAAFRPVPIELDRRKKREQDARRRTTAKDIVSNVRILVELQRILDGGTSLSELTSGNLFARGAKEVDTLERKLSPQVPELALLSEATTEEAAQDLVAWLQLVRLALATSITRAVPYSRVWGEVVGIGKDAVASKGIYGTLGYWLSEHVPELAEIVVRHPTYESLRDAAPLYPWMAGYVTFAGDPRGQQYPIGRQLAAVTSESIAWRDHCVRVGCTAWEKGQLWPFGFAALTADEHGDETLAGRMPDHMHARPTATERVLQVREHWRFVHDLMKLPDDTLNFKINAGSLRYGGAHPPHRTHRNGAMFDLDLTVPTLRALDPICTQPMKIETGPVTIRRGEDPEPTIGERFKQLLKDSIFSRLEPVPNEDPTTVFEFCATDFRYANERRVAGKKPEVIARRFTQCMLLTLPSEVLFASWKVLREAWNDLLTTVNTLVAKNEESLGDDGRSALKQLQEWLGAPAPETKPSKAHFRFILYPRDDHDDHWHASWDPEDLDGDSKTRRKSLLWIAQNRGLLFPEDKINQ